MIKIENCIYCGVSFDPTKGQGDHILPVQLGEFRNDIRFRRICTSCNNHIGKSEQQLLSCGPESFLKSFAKPKVPQRRQRGCSLVNAAMGVRSPQSTINHGDHKEIVKRSKDKPDDVFPVDQIVIHDEKNEEYFVELFSGMRPEQLKNRIKKQGIRKINTLWIHCSETHLIEFEQLVKNTWSKRKIQYLPRTEAGITQVKGLTTFTVNEHYFRSLAKIAFHYYLIHTRRGFRGDEVCFEPIRNFIMNGGTNREAFFEQSGPKFAMPFGKISSGGVITPTQWCHIIAADETNKMSLVYLRLFVGNGCIPRPHYIKIADINSKIAVLNSTWGHVYLYDESPKPDCYAGEVEQAQIARIR